MLSGFLKVGCKTNGYKNYRDAYSFGKSLFLYLPSREARARAAYFLGAARRHSPYDWSLACAPGTADEEVIKQS